MQSFVYCQRTTLCSFTKEKLHNLYENKFGDLYLYLKYIDNGSCFKLILHKTSFKLSDTKCTLPPHTYQQFSYLPSTPWHQQRLSSLLTCGCVIIVQWVSSSIATTQMLSNFQVQNLSQVSVELLYFVFSIAFSLSSFSLLFIQILKVKKYSLIIHLCLIQYFKIK